MSVIRHFTSAAFRLQLSPHIAVCCCLGIGKGKQNIWNNQIFYFRKKVLIFAGVVTCLQVDSALATLNAFG